MADHSQTTANSPKDPTLCKMGCGFFGSGATGDCCSKCWNELQKKQGVPEKPKTTETKLGTKPLDVVTEEPSPMDVEPTPVATPVVEAPKKKKKKKANYKNMMAGFLETSDAKDIEKEKERLRQVTGGGAFSKIDKI